MGSFWNYMDDLLVATGLGKEILHQQIVHKILNILEKESYFLHTSKCVFEQTCIEYLSIIVDENGEKLTVDLKKAAGLCDWPHTLNTIKEVCSILGGIGLPMTLNSQFCQHHFTGHSHCHAPAGHLPRLKVS